MRSADQVNWLHRLLLAFAAMFLASLAALVFIVLRDMLTHTDVSWGNGGEEQIVGYFAIYGGIGSLFTYIFFVVPLVLLWPVRSQLKHWYAILLVSLFWLPPAMAFIGNRRAVDMLHDLLHPFHPHILWLMEPFAPLACGLYLLLLLHRTKRAKPTST